MHAPSVARFGFRIRTRQGLIVDPVLIPGRDAADAERKLRQIYLGCVILARKDRSMPARSRTLDGRGG